MAVVGCGHIGHRHIAMIGFNPDMELVAVADVRPPVECDAPAGVPFFGSIDALLAAAMNIDVVCICTPNSLHARQAARVLASGADVLIEKPIAISVPDAEAIRRAEEESGRRVFTVFQNRYTPTSQWLRSVVSSGALGTISSVSVNCFWNRDKRYYAPGGWHGTREYDGGTLFTQFSHFVDLLLWTLGDVNVISAQAADFAHKDLTDFEDTGVFLFRSVRDGALGAFTYSTVTPIENFECAMSIVGTRGSVRLGGAYMNELQYCNVMGLEAPRFTPPPAPNDYGGYKGSAANHALVFSHLADTLLGRVDAGSMPGWEDGFRVVDLICRVYRAMGADFTSSVPLSYKP